MAQKQKRKSQSGAAASGKRSGIILPAVVALAAIGFLVWTLTRSRESEPTAQVQATTPAAVNQAPPPAAPMPTVPPDVAQASEADIAAVPRLSVADFKKELDAGTAVPMDVRDIESFGALHIPLVYVSGELEYLPKGKKIVAYCT